MNRTRDWIRRWLGIDGLRYEIGEVQRGIKNLAIANRLGIGQIIAKIDPMFGKPEIDADRKAESDKLSQEAIARILADDMARKHTLGEI